MNAAKSVATGDRSLLKSRIVIDLFGPLIDISVLDHFTNIKQARYLSLPRLIKTANQKHLYRLPFWPWRWTETKVLSYVLSALKDRKWHDGLVDMTILQMLVEACGHGTQVVVVSTAPDSAVFEAARRVIVDAAASFSGGSSHPFEFRWIGEKTSWEQILTELKKNDDRYTYVLHDSSADKVGVRGSDLYDEWVPSVSIPQDLHNLLKQAFEREQRRAPIPWLDAQDTMSLKDYKVIGDFMLFDTSKRVKLQRRIDDLISSTLSLRRWV